MLYADGFLEGQKLKCGYYVNKGQDLGIFLKDLRLQKAEGKFMEHVVLTLFQLFLPLSTEEAQERLQGAAAAPETPKHSEEPLRAGAFHGG